MSVSAMDAVVLGRYRIEVAGCGGSGNVGVVDVRAVDGGVWIRWAITKDIPAGPAEQTGRLCGTAALRHLGGHRQRAAHLQVDWLLKIWPKIVQEFIRR